MSPQTGKREVRNLKGEIIQDSQVLDEKEWYHLSPSTWILIGGLILFNIGCFFDPKLINGLFRFLDFRLWSWWYFVVLLLIVAFSVKWFWLFQSWDDLDQVDADIGKRFLYMSITLTVEMLILVLLNATGVLRYIFSPLWYWVGYGHYSNWCFPILLLMGVVVTVTIYVVKEWITTAFQS